MSVIRIRLNSGLETLLTELADKQRVSKNHIMNKAIKDYVQRQSMEYIRWKDTLSALESIKAGKAVDGDETAEWLNSWGVEQEMPSPKH